MYAEEVQGIIALCLGKKGWRGGGAALSSALSMGHMRLEGHRPPTWLPIPDNCLVVSAEGLANSRMAGGAGLGSHRRSNRS